MGFRGKVSFGGGWEHSLSLFFISLWLMVCLCNSWLVLQLSKAGADLLAALLLNDSCWLREGGGSRLPADDLLTPILIKFGKITDRAGFISECWAIHRSSAGEYNSLGSGGTNVVLLMNLQANLLQETIFFQWVILGTEWSVVFHGVIWERTIQHTTNEHL